MHRVAALFDGFDEPAGVADVVGDELAGLAIDGFCLGHAFIYFVDVEPGGVFLGEAGGVFARLLVALDDRVRRDGGHAVVPQQRARAALRCLR